MINPHGSETLKPLLVTDKAERDALAKEAESLPSLLLNSAAAANAVMLGGGYFTPLERLHESHRCAVGSRAHANRRRPVLAGTDFEPHE